MRAKSINEDFTHLKPKTPEELEIAFENRLEELYHMDSEDMITAIYTDVRDNLPSPLAYNVTWKQVASKLLDNIHPADRKQVIEFIYRDYYNKL